MRQLVIMPLCACAQRYNIINVPSYIIAVAAGTATTLTAHFLQELKEFTVATQQLKRKMKGSTILAGACLLALVFTVIECTLTLDIVKRQETLCGNPNDTTTALGICALAFELEDKDTVCDDCLEVIEDYLECEGLDDYVQDIKDECGGVAGVGVALLSTISAVLVALAATLN